MKRNYAAIAARSKAGLHAVMYLLYSCRTPSSVLKLF